MPTIAFATLGCRVNQYDTDSMRGLFLAAGFTEADFNGPADVYVINTCSVTQVGEKKSRQLIRRTKKRNDAAKVIEAPDGTGAGGLLCLNFDAIFFHMNSPFFSGVFQI